MMLDGIKRRRCWFFSKRLKNNDNDAEQRKKEHTRKNAVKWVYDMAYEHKNVVLHNGPVLELIWSIRMHVDT